MLESTERTVMTKNTEEKQCRYELFDYSPVGICVIDRDFQVIHWNSCLEDWSGISRSAILGTDLREFCPRFREDYYTRRIESVFSSAVPVVFSPQLHKSLFPIFLFKGKPQIQHIKLTNLPDVGRGEAHALFSIEDVTELYLRVRQHRHEHETALSEIRLRAKIEEELRSTLEMKDYLIKEVHHRIKNNLSMVASLIGLQEQNLSTPHDQTVLNELRGKIRSISLVHEKLYVGNDLKSIAIQDYLADLLPMLHRSSVPADCSIRITQSIHPISISVDAAIPFALIVTELFINAVKYAFPESRHGTISISFAPSADHAAWILTVKDDGTGLPDTYDIQKNETLGSQLLTTFTEQLGGSIRVSPKPGTEINITFPPALITHEDAT